MTRLTEKAAIEFAKSGVWKEWTDEQVVKFQLYQDMLCMDFSRVHRAMEKVLGRPILTHEFAFTDQLVLEYEGKKGKPTFQEIMDLIPKDKQIIFVGI